MRKISQITKKVDIYRIPCQNFSARETEVKAIIIHCFGLSLENMIQTLNQNGVSVHYIIPALTGAKLKKQLPKLFNEFTPQYPHDIPIIQLVDDQNKAYHVGNSKFANFNSLPGCTESLNHCSVGIEFEIPEYANGDGSDWYKFGSCNRKQVKTGLKLIRYLLEDHNIPKQNIFAHSTVSVERKTDPGPLFFWRELERSNLGYFPTPAPVDAINKVDYIRYKLQKIGFNCTKDKNLNEYIDAYIMQFAPELWEGKNNKVSTELIHSLAGFTWNFTY